MAEIIRLGGNINLEGFSDLEPIKLIVVKKIVGTYAKDLSEKIDFDSFTVNLAESGGTGGKTTVKIAVTGASGTISDECSDKNLFVALDNCLKKIKDKA